MGDAEPCCPPGLAHRGVDDSVVRQTKRLQRRTYFFFAAASSSRFFILCIPCSDTASPTGSGRPSANLCQADKIT